MVTIELTSEEVLYLKEFLQDVEVDLQYEDEQHEDGICKLVNGIIKKLEEIE